MKTLSRTEEPRREDYAECACEALQMFPHLPFPCGGCEEYQAARDDFHRKNAEEVECKHLVCDSTADGGEQCLACGAMWGEDYPEEGM
jgi:hypothetical protein